MVASNSELAFILKKKKKKINEVIVKFPVFPSVALHNLLKPGVNFLVCFVTYLDNKVDSDWFIW